MNRLTVATTAIAVALLMSLAAGCSGGGDKTARSEPPPIPTSPGDPGCGAVPPRLRGTYTMETKTDELPPEVADMQTGEWELRLGPRHRIAVLAPQGNAIDLSPACVSGDRIAVAEEPAGGSCAGLGPALYRWKLRERDLILTKIAERCVDRAYNFTAKPWQRRSAAKASGDGAPISGTGQPAGLPTSTREIQRSALQADSVRSQHRQPPDDAGPRGLQRDRQPVRASDERAGL